MNKLFFPKYEQFECFASECRMNCCKNYSIYLFGWEAAQFGKRKDWNDIDGEGHDIREFLTEGDQGWECRMCEGACVFLDRKKDLCRIQLRHGQNSMPSVCRTYPRVITKYPDRVEYALDPCCPAVTRMLLDWNIGEILAEGEGQWTPTDEKAVNRQKMMDMIADGNNSLEYCFRRMKEEYGVVDDIPEIGLEGRKLEFGRKFVAFLLWSYLIPYEGIGLMDNIMAQIFDMARCYFDHCRPLAFENDDEMSYDLARFMNDYVVRMKFDTEIEGRYIDSNDEPGGEK